jgi:hypothetical protein
MNSFTLDISKFAASCGDKANASVRKVCLQVLAGVVLKTPVDTGRARGNWQASVNAPSTVATDDKDKTGVVTISAAKAAVDGAPGNVFWLANNLPYIERLEYGHSKQSPKGMVRLTIKEVKASLR